jgi:hypothetical protein
MGNKTNGFSQPATFCSSRKVVQKRLKEGLYQFQIFIAKQENYLFALRLDLASL